MMEKQWSTDIRNGPEGSLVGMEIWDFRSWKRNAAINTGAGALPLASFGATLQAGTGQRTNAVT